MKINHNIAAMRTLNELGKVNNKASDAMLRLSSGLRINGAADDAAGMAISNKMNAQIRGLAQANRNTMDGVSMVQTAEGALNETHAILNRMRELSVQAANGTYSEEDREAIQQEINELTDEITRIAETTAFNTKPLLQGDKNAIPLIEGNMVIESTGKVGEALGSLEFKSPVTKEDMEELAGQSIVVGDKEFVFTNSESDVVLEDHMIAINLDEVIDVVGEEATDYSPHLYTTLEIAIEANVDIFIKRVPSTNPPVLSKFDFTTAPGTTNLNGLVVANGVNKEPENFILQVGANKGQVLTIGIGNMSASALGLVGIAGQLGFSDSENVEGGAALNFMNQEDAKGAIEAIDKAIQQVSDQRSKIGAVQNRLEHTVSNLGVSEENLTAAVSRIQDADMAYEMAEYTKYNVISQAATSMLAQANQRPQQVLQLLQK